MKKGNQPTNLKLHKSPKSLCRFKKPTKPLTLKRYRRNQRSLKNRKQS